MIAKNQGFIENMQTILFIMCPVMLMVRIIIENKFCVQGSDYFIIIDDVSRLQRWITTLIQHYNIRRKRIQG